VQPSLIAQPYDNEDEDDSASCCLGLSIRQFASNQATKQVCKGNSNTCSCNNRRLTSHFCPSLDSRSPCKSDILSGVACLQVATPPPKVGRLQGFISKLRRGGSKEEEEYDLSRPASIAGPRPLDSEADLSPATKSGTSSLVTHPCACDSVSRHALINCMHGTPVDKCRMSF